MRELFRNDENVRAMNHYEPKVSIHEKTCRSIFQGIKNGMDLYVSVERIMSENELEETYINEIPLADMQYVRISVLTDEIIEYDLEMFSNGDNFMPVNHYRPYFVSFVAEIEKT